MRVNARAVLFALVMTIFKKSSGHHLRIHWNRSDELEVELNTPCPVSQFMCVYVCVWKMKDKSKQTHTHRPWHRLPSFVHKKLDDWCAAVTWGHAAVAVWSWQEVGLQLEFQHTWTLDKPQWIQHQKLWRKNLKYILFTKLECSVMWIKLCFV